VLTNRLEELLNNGYTQGVVVSSTDVVIRPFVLGWSQGFVQATVDSDIHIFRVVPNSEKPIPFSAVLSSLSSSSLSAHIASLRRDITTHYIDHTLDYPTSLSFSQEPDQFGSFIHRLRRLPSSTNHEPTPLSNLSRILEFMNDKLFPCLPQSQCESFPRSLAKPLTTSIMTRLLIPSLPSTLDALPTFLELTRTSVDFETKYIVALLKGDTFDREIRNWVDNVCAHYERGRRQRILDDVRETILASVSRPKDTFHAELVTVINVTRPSVEPAPVAPIATDSWNLNNDHISRTNSSGSGIDAGDAWGFDDEVEEPEEAPVSKPDSLEEPEPDPNEAWGWNDEEQPEASPQDPAETTPEEPTEQDQVWDDDPWAEDSVANEVAVPDHLPVASSIASPPQLAPAASASSSRQQPLSNGHPSTNGHVNGHHPPSRPSQNANTVNKEPYSVSVLIRRIVQAVEDALHEGKALASSGIFPKTSLSTSTPGTLIMQTGALALDLYRALHPVVAASGLSQPAGCMQFSSDCYYLSEEIARMLKHEQGLPSVQERLEECKGNLKVLADSGFYQGIVSGQHCRRNLFSYQLYSTSGRTNNDSGRCFSGCGWLCGHIGPGTL
jgi:centromere/kinetochore protein ZW10